ncbi:hypothetical protein [Streptomyces sp. NPDC058394]|uniref:hypothetical protein n=1 Tax=unclassified Streptomyces TaxID=2593676 RepID=UPI003656B3F0
MGVRELERITARRGELDVLAEELAKQLQEVQAEREELVVAERVLNRLPSRTGPRNRTPLPSPRLPPGRRAGQSC